MAGQRTAHPVEADQPSGEGEAQLPELAAFLLALGRALVAAGAPVNEIEARLLTVAEAYGSPRARILVFPTFLQVVVEPGRATMTELTRSAGGALRLDQIAALYELLGRAEAGRVPVGEGSAAVAQVYAMRPRHGPAVTVTGHAILTVGICLVLQPTPGDLVLTALLGVLVGLLRLVGARWGSLQTILPVLAALVVSGLAFAAADHGWVHADLRAVIAPLATFLPGAAVTMGVVELSAGELVTGSSRLVAGTLQLLLLAFGILVGSHAAGAPGPARIGEYPHDLLGAWAPWLGVLVFGLGNAVYQSAPRRQFGWLLVVLYAAWLGQWAGGRAFGGYVSGFTGALVMTIVAYAAERLPSGPPALESFLPAFWLLVPGALGLIGLTDYLAHAQAAGGHDLVAALAATLSIALGVLCGYPIYRSVSRFLPRAGP